MSAAVLVKQQLFVLEGEKSERVKRGKDAVGELRIDERETLAASPCLSLERALSYSYEDVNHILLDLLSAQRAQLT